MSNQTRDEDVVGYDSRSDTLLQALKTDLDRALNGENKPFQRKQSRYTQNR